MTYQSRLPKSVSLEYRNRVRHECEKAGISGSPYMYPDLTKTVFGTSDHETSDSRLVRLVTKALCENMRDDAAAGRPLSAVVVHSAKTNMPGSYFFECAFDLKRFVAGQDATEFVAREWDDYRRWLGVDADVDDELPVKRVIDERKKSAASVKPTEISFTKVGLPYGWMSNMSAYRIIAKGKYWRSAEALFQAMRFDNEEVQESIRRLNSPMSVRMRAESKSLQDLMTVVPCSELDVSNLRQVLRWKAQQNDWVRRALLCTGCATIIADHTNRQNGNGLFWGAAFVDGTWIGENVLGKLWMELRQDLQKNRDQSVGNERLAA